MLTTVNIEGALGTAQLEEVHHQGLMRMSTKSRRLFRTIAMGMHTRLLLVLIANLSKASAQEMPRGAPTREQLASDNKLFITLANKALKRDEPAEPTGIEDDFRTTLHRLEMLRPDIWLRHHIEYFDLIGKR